MVAGVLPEDNDNLDAEDANGPNEGMKEDQRLAHGLSVVYDDDWGETGGSKGGEGEEGRGRVYVGGMTGLSHFSKNRITGIKELIVACVFAGELGKVR